MTSKRTFGSGPPELDEVKRVLGALTKIVMPLAAGYSDATGAAMHTGSTVVQAPSTKLVDYLENLKSHNMQDFRVVPNFLLGAYFQNQAQRLTMELTTAPFTLFEDQKGVRIHYQAATRQLWVCGDIGCTVADGRKEAAAARIGKLTGWRLPSKAEITQFAKAAGNPMRKGQKYRLNDLCYWLCNQGRIDLDDGQFVIESLSPGALLLVADVLPDPRAMLELALEHNWKQLKGGENSDYDALTALRHPDIKNILRDVDYVACRQPRLDDALFTDPNKGLWEAWGLSDTEQTRIGVRARDPARDVREGFVAIDFGTSSTVVAWDNNGRAELMRVGVKDFWAKEQPGDYENPTVLEFIDFNAMLFAWQATAYRPGVLWDQVRCSHEALHNWRNNESKPEVVGSILGKIKQWALRQEKDYRLRISDQINGVEHELAPLASRNPVKGQPLTVGDSDSFDPVELYAWFLGMNINWRQRGLFLRYYMSFPVDYPRSVKDNILAAFRRGLQRSLPETLIRQPVFSDFTVEERASEPAAYAAIALPALGIEPGLDKGEAYAVFDFGGGTADFDFGFYRQPTPDEEDEGWEAVFERCGTAGDKFLGGENLLENMAYQTFRHNLELCREKKIAFTRPLDADDFAGSEMFLEKTRAAGTNSLMLMARLRPLWETGVLSDNGSGITRIELLSREGKMVSCELSIDSGALLNYLEQRIEKGVEGFFAAMRAAFADDVPAQVHVLLAGNASRSHIVHDLFGLPMFPDDDLTQSPAFARIQTQLHTLFGDRAPSIKAYAPLAPDADNVYRPTGKTGVALGLLKLCPGSALKTVDHARQSADNEAPFAYHVGRVRQGKFQPGLGQGSAYGEWHELGVPRERVFNLYYTVSPLAYTGNMGEGHIDLNKRPLHLAGDTPGQRVFGRAVKPDQVEICTASSKEAALQGAFENLRLIDLR
jgi:hypothetical protein